MSFGRYIEPLFRDRAANLGDVEGKKKRKGIEKKEGTSDSWWRTRASGKRRRGAYQRHLLIYFAAVGRQSMVGDPH